MKRFREIEFFPMRIYVHHEGWYVSFLEINNFGNCTSWIGLSLSFRTDRGFKVEWLTEPTA